MQIVNDKDIKKLTDLDPVFKKIHDTYGAPPNWQRPEGFESLCMIILEQQVSLASAAAHFKKLKDHLGSISPKRILKLSDEAMRNCQVSRQKSSYLRALSEAVINKKPDLENLSNLPEAEVREVLMSVKGIGNWTIDVYLMFCLQAKDIFPIGDIAIRNTMKALTDCKTAEEMMETAETWRPYRTLASYFLWHYYLSKKIKK